MRLDTLPSKPILKTTQSVPSSCLMSPGKKDGEVRLALGVDLGVLDDEMEITKVEDTPTLSTVPTLSTTPPPQDLARSLSSTSSLVTLPIMTSKERIREKNLEIRELKQRVKRKDEYILNLARALKAVKEDSHDSVRLPVASPIKSTPNLMVLVACSFGILYLITLFGPHFSSKSLCMPVRCGRSISARSTTAPATYRFPWLTKFGESTCQNFFDVDVLKFEYSPPVLALTYHNGERKIWRNVERWRVEVGGERIRVWR